jgi:hypothetical protein
MNERIRELAEQAHHSTADELSHLQRVHNRTYDLDESATIYNEKFAELIVKETMQVVANNLPQNTYLDVADAVIKHFGVEE